MEVELPVLGSESGSESPKSAREARLMSTAAIDRTKRSATRLRVWSSRQTSTKFFTNMWQILHKHVADIAQTCGRYCTETCGRYCTNMWQILHKHVADIAQKHVA